MAQAVRKLFAANPDLVKLTYGSFLHHEAEYKNQVYAETWGHLAPDSDAIYTGSIIFARGRYHADGVVVLRSAFKDTKGRKLDASPWQVRDENDFCDRKAKKYETIYTFRGIYFIGKRGKPHYKGEIRSSPLG